MSMWRISYEIIKIIVLILLYTHSLRSTTDLVVKYCFLCYQVGGYEDEAGKAARLSMRLIDFFAKCHQSNLDFRLQTFCVGKCNTKRGRNGHNEPKIGEKLIVYSCE